MQLKQNSLKQSELNRREWKMQGVDRALYESSIQLQSQRMELYQANKLTDQSHREESWLCNERHEKKSFSGRSCKKLSRMRRLEKDAVQKRRERDS